MAKSKEIGGGAARGGSTIESGGYWKDTGRKTMSGTTIREYTEKTKVKISPRDEAIAPKTRAQTKAAKKSIDEMNRVSFGLHLLDKAKKGMPPRMTGGITGRGASAVNPTYRNMGN